jgi:hypothetical protein
MEDLFALNTGMAPTRLSRSNSRELGLGRDELAKPLRGSFVFFAAQGEFPCFNSRPD